MSYNQPPPSPYGQQPEGPEGPEGPGGAGGAAEGQGLSQQPAQDQQGGYGPPAGPAQPAQQPHGQVPPQQPYGQPGYGQPPVPPRGGNNKRTGIIVGVAVVAVIAVLAGVLIAHKGNSGSDGLSNDGKKYKLTTPATVATDYKKSGDPSASDSGFDSGDLAKLKALGLSDPQQVTAGYVSGSETTGKLLSFSGVYGKLADPKKVADGMMADLRAQTAKNGTDSDGTKTELIGGVQTVHPAGADDAIVECQNAKVTDGASKKAVTTPICLWSDYSTFGTILPIDLSALAVGTGGGPTVDGTATLLSQVRKDTRVEIK
ncbi:hypothetical protein GA0115240_168427 [Streptomyces sp. DvalAA-14]|uniref:hypothetical protein n=1 Tax=unclassified Streptomyces TaxID=2593676 RepID=UPI00081B944C|nr:MULTISPECIES: hypothetical protein [unclassified Streptomyces]MYS24751.1 hypothetical protein [Streptomyces sp. SID4948]SCE49011.1 hypothetical protein GA0115240_168427 [Streptomyces sp. DvalAA-14]